MQWGAKGPPKIMRGTFVGGNVVACKQQRLPVPQKTAIFLAGKLATQMCPVGLETLGSTQRLSQFANQP